MKMDVCIARVIVIWLFVASGVRVTSGSTHWVVTEDGKIQEQVYSVFHLRRPYDLVALMQQEMRANMVESFMDQLDGQIEDIDSKRETETNLQERFYGSDRDCLLADKPLAEHNLFVSTVATCEDVDTRLQELCRNSRPMSNPTSRPNCTRMSQLDVSPQAFERLIEQEMEELQNMSISPDFSLVGVLPNVEDISAFGHLINMALEQNKNSWGLYNIAGYYFRLAGDARGAIECIRRALHFSPPHQKHIALLNLGNVLHHLQRSDTASVIVETALELDPDNAVLQFTLGNIYAALAEYNKSVEAFDAVLRSNPDFEAAAARRHAVLCHSKLETALEIQYNSLQNTLSELVNFEKRLEFWQKQQLKMIQEQTSPDVRLSSEIDYAAWKIRLQLQDEVKKIQEQTRVSDSPNQKNVANKKKDCTKLQKNGHLAPGCGGQVPVVANVKMQFDYPFKEVEMQVAKLKSDLLAKQNEKVVNRLMYLVQVESDKVTKAGQTTKISMPLSELSSEECERVNSMDGLLITMPIFFFPDKNDMGVGKILSDIAEDPDGEMMVPVCHGDSSNGFDNLWNWIFSNINLSHDLVASARSSVQKYISTCCGFISIEEFGRRIAVALTLNKGLAAKWMLYHMAASYWWATGDLKNLSECLMQSKALSSEQHKHVSVMPLASLLSLNGLHLAAINFLKYSVDVNVYNPDIVMILADLYVMTGELDKALAQYSRVINEEPENEDAWRRVMFTTCQLREQRAEQSGVTVKFRDVHQRNGRQMRMIGYVSEKEEGVNGHCHNSADKAHCADEPMKLSAGTSSKTNVEKVLDDVILKSDVEGLPSDAADLNLSVDQEASGVSSVQGNSDSTTNNNLAVEDDPLPDILLQVQEKQKFTAPFLCKHLSPTNFKHFTSTWLSVSAKGIVVSKLLDTKESVKGPSLQPVCDPNHPSSALTLDHLAGIKHRSRLSYTAETGLREAFQTLGREGEGPEAVETMGTRLAIALQKNSTSWVLTTLAALYWRVTGNASHSINCLRQALHYAPRNMKDIPLISLANIFHRAGLYNDALIVANMALEISPGFVVIHFTLANIFAAKGNIDQARAFYESTLNLQSSFEPARDRLRAISCSSEPKDTFNSPNNRIQ